MAIVIVLCIAVLIALIVLVVGAPLREAAARRAGAGTEETEGTDEPEDADPQSAERDELEAAREAKYREIRDAELDFRTGKLSERDYRELDAELRAEALAILDELDAGVRPRGASGARSRSGRTGPRRRPSSD
jgi:flagellar biosynthesis/type III secretory pathway M-ring protein FliF/YscJ